MGKLGLRQFNSLQVTRLLNSGTWTDIQIGMSLKPGLLSQAGLWRLSKSLNPLWDSVSSSVKLREVKHLVGLLGGLELIAAQGPEAFKP